MEIFYDGRAGAGGAGALHLDLLAPKFDLPLENITWRVSLGDKWLVQHWSGSLQFAAQELKSPAAALDPQFYLKTEYSLRLARTEEAREFYDLGNSFPGQGQSPAGPPRF